MVSWSVYYKADPTPTPTPNPEQVSWSVYWSGLAHPYPNPTPNPDQVSWSVYYKAANELDSLDGKDAWRDAPGGYAASAVASASRQLAAAREAGDAEELTQLLRTMMMRNHLQVDLPQPHLIPNPNPKPNPDQVDLPQLHTECRVGTKHAIEAYDAEQVASLP